MSPVLRSLLWKEWREQRWKLAFGCVILGGYILIGLKARLLLDDTIIASGLLAGAFLLPIFVAMSVVARERADESIHTLLALPVRPSVTLTVKMVVAACVSVLPLVVGLVLAIVVAGGRECSSSEIVVFCTAASLFNLATLVWTVAFGLGQPSEARTGLVGIAVVTSWIIVAMLDKSVVPWGAGGAFAFVTPLGFFSELIREPREMLPDVLVWQSTLGLVLMWWTAGRWAKLGRAK